MTEGSTRTVEPGEHGGALTVQSLIFGGGCEGSHDGGSDAVEALGAYGLDDGVGLAKKGVRWARNAWRHCRDRKLRRRE